MLFVLIIGLEVLNLGKPLAQQSWQEARFDEFGFAVKIPPGWKIYSTPKPDKASLIVFKNISAGLYDDCSVTVAPNDTYANLTQEQIDSQLQASLMQYPVPDYSRKEFNREEARGGAEPRERVSRYSPLGRFRQTRRSFKQSVYRDIRSFRKGARRKALLLRSHSMDSPPAVHRQLQCDFARHQCGHEGVWIGDFLYDYAIYCVFCDGAA